jgi:hypothetical protein
VHDVKTCVDDRTVSLSSARMSFRALNSFQKRPTGTPTDQTADSPAHTKTIILWCVELQSMS